MRKNHKANVHAGRGRSEAIGWENLPEASGKKPMIELRGLGMRYRTQSSAIQVLQGIDLDVMAGERVAVVGPSGSGKTTLLLLLAGLERPTEGSVVVDGADLAALDPDGLADLRRDRLGIVFQSFHLMPSLSALDNVALPLEIAGRSDARARAREVLGRVGLDSRISHYPAQLSGGEQQRVAIARALVHHPSLILADEPTGNLDDRTGQAVGDLLFDLHAGSGTTLMLITHDAEFAARCDRILRLHEGRLAEFNDYRDAVDA
jgi:putative ABC transport system ATP-binding protein